MLSRLIVVALFLQCVASHEIFQKKIPNGDHVPFPCRPGEIWQGVGHWQDQGTGDRNPFGMDFGKSGFNWTLVCPLDSDGDGKTNGAELGDPNCIWTENAVPSHTDGLSHPGICDPWNSPACMQKPLTGSKYATQKDWLEDMCKKDGLDCPAMNETGIRKLDIRIITGTPVPSVVTTYMCQIFDLFDQGVPSDQDFHMVAVTPIIDNKNILHHMVLFGCTDDTKPTNGSYVCGMTPGPSCQEFINVWTVGLDGECLHHSCGFKFGRSGSKIVAIQLHWNNPEKRSDYTDSSGLTVYYTPKLRTYDAGVLLIGDQNFYLPPRKQELMITGVCTETCTQKIMNGTVNVTAAWNHMHYAGNKMNIQVKRNGSVIKYLTDDKTYSYDNPQVFSYPDPFVLQPGDGLYTYCYYNTSTRNKTTQFGEATEDEMCYGFLTYYPRQNVTSSSSSCISIQGIKFVSLVQVLVKQH